MMVMVMGVCVLCLETGQWGTAGEIANSEIARLTRRRGISLAKVLYVACWHFDQWGFGFCACLIRSIWW